MITLTERLDDYISVRRSLGYDLSFAARVLRGFTRFADREGTDHITVDLFLRWKKGFGKADNIRGRRGLEWCACSPAGCRDTNARTEVPPPGLIAGKLRRGRPYIYSEAEVAMIVARAAKLPSRYGIRGWTCSTLFGLIAVTGLRINEAIALDEGDVDLDEGVITVKRSKNGAARFRTVGAEHGRQLRAYRTELTRCSALRPGRSSGSKAASGRPNLLRAL